jgi:heme/copper-type cytochrome/quinol oxidase subunit 3
MATQELEREEPRAHPMYLGMILFIVSEVFLFGALFWTYYYLRTVPGWPPEHPAATPAIINTVILLSSSGTIWLAGRNIRRGNQTGLAWGLGITMLLAGIFLGITVWEWLPESFQPWTNAYGSIFFTLTGFHALHVFAGLVIMATLLNRTLKHRFTRAGYLGVEVGSLYWHFVDFIWLFVFSTIFIIR